MIRKVVLLLILAFTCSQAFAQVKHIVFNIEGTLIQGITQKNYNAFTNKDQMIKVTEGKNLHYYIYPKIPHLLSYLQRQDQFVIHFFTHRSRTWAKSVLSSINLPKPIQGTVSSFLEGNGVNSLFSAEDLTDGKLDLRKITSDLNNVVVVTSFPDVVLNSQKRNELFIGKNLFYFESYAFAASEKIAAAADLQSNFPNSEEEWFVEQNKSSFIFQILSTVKASSSKSLINDILKLQINKEEMTKKGQLVSRYNFQDKILLYKFNDKQTKVLGCGVYSPISDSFIADKDIDDCLKYFSFKNKFRFDSVARKVEACEIKDEATGAYIKDAPDLSSCLTAANGDLKYYWMGKKKAICASYIDLNYVQQEDKSLCSHGHVVQEGDEVSVQFLFEDANGKPVSIIPEIEGLVAGATLSQSLYNNYDSRLIGFSIVQWLRLKKNETTLRDGDYDFLNDSRIVMAFSFKNFNLILKNGFLNQHETKTSGGTLNNSVRATAENGFLNFLLEPSYGRYGNEANRLRPKYSYLMLDKFRLDMGLNSLYPQYGNVYAVFKNNIKPRSTFTPGDSLAMSGTFIRTFWYRSPNVLKVKATQYFETQIWGELSISEVDYFLANCTEPLNPVQIQQLKASGVPVYDCKASYYGGSTMPYNVNKTTRL